MKRGRRNISAGEGTRRLAHNTDDLHQRWLTRREGEPQQTPQQGTGEEIVPNFSPLTSIEAARTTRQELGSRMTELDSVLNKLKQTLESGSRDERIEARRLQRKAKEEKSALAPKLRTAKQYIRDWSDASDKSTLDEIKGKAGPKLAATISRYQELVNQLKQGEQSSSLRTEADVLEKAIRDQVMMMNRREKR